MAFVGPVLLRFIRNIWIAQDVHEDVLFGVVICTTLTIWASSCWAEPSSESGGLPIAKRHPPSLPTDVSRIGGTTTAGALVRLENNWAQLIFYFQSLFSQIFLVVFVARMIGLHTGRR